MSDLTSFFIVLFAGLFSAQIFNKLHLHLPWVVALILSGIIIGPNAFNIFSPSPAIELIGEIGLIFLMFMAGLEADLTHFSNLKSKVISLAIFNGLLPLVIGFSIGLLFDYSRSASFLLGIIFISSSVAVIVPTLQANKLLNSTSGKTLLSATIIEDMFSLILLSLLIQTSAPVTTLPIPIFYSLMFGSLFFLRWVISQSSRIFLKKIRHTQAIFQQELRTIFVILIGTVVITELLGLHPIIGGFFAGTVLSRSVVSHILKEKLQTISYGIFIPVFFVTIGTQTDLRIFFTATNATLLAITIITGSILAKFISGWLGARVSGFSPAESALIGASTIPQLSTTLAAAFAGLELGILDQPLVGSLVILSLITTIIGPLLTRYFLTTTQSQTPNKSFNPFQVFKTQIQK